MPAPATADDFLALVRRSNQLDPARLDAFVSRAGGRPALPEAPRDLAALLVSAGLLTAFQAEQLLLGKWRGFTVGGYRVLERLGSGGAGTVYLAEHEVMRRRVAVKVLPASYAGEREMLERFRREAQAVAALDHPNIVRAYDFRQENGLHFLVMEYVQGQSLQQLLEQSGPLPVGQACEYARQAALGLAHAHEAELVHRDIKPGNLLVDTAGTVKVLDLGLARYAPKGTESLTREFNQHAVMGTADYLAPEQALNLHDVDARADVYSLGVTLYALLAGRPPFYHAETVTQKLLCHQMREPRRLRQLRAEVPAGLESLVARMLAKRPEDRPQSAAEVAEALLAWAEGGSPAEEDGLRLPFPAEPPAPRRSKERIRCLQPADLPPAPPEVPAAGDAVGRFAPPAVRPALPTRRGRAAGFWVRVVCVSVLPLLLVAGGLALVWRLHRPAVEAGGPGAEVEPGPWRPGDPAFILPAARGEMFRFEPQTSVNRVAFAPGGQRVLAACGDKLFRLYDLKERLVHSTFLGHPGAVTSIAFARDGQRVVSAGADGGVRVWSLTGAGEARNFKAHPKRANGAAFSADELRVVSCGDDQAVRVWDIQTGKQVGLCKGHQAAVRGVAVRPGGPRQAVTAGLDRTARLWDLDENKEVRQFRGPALPPGTPGGFTAVAVTPDGRRAVIGSEEGKVWVWHLDTGDLLHAFTGHQGAVWAVAVSPDGRRALSGGADRRIRLWDLEGQSLVTTLDGHTREVTGLAFAPDGRHCASGSLDKTVRLWGLPAPAPPPDRRR